MLKRRLTIIFTHLSTRDWRFCFAEAKASEPHPLCSMDDAFSEGQPPPKDHCSSFTTNFPKVVHGSTLPPPRMKIRWCRVILGLDGRNVKRSI